VQYVKGYLSANWKRLQQMVTDELPRPAELASLLDAAKSPYRFQEMGYSRDLIEDAIICSKEISQKYSLLYILDEIGLLEHFAHETVEDLA
jgi:glycerol-1-phosphate dehydrogenase [NAD(P)+]